MPCLFGFLLNKSLFPHSRFPHGLMGFRDKWMEWGFLHLVVGGNDLVRRGSVSDSPQIISPRSPQLPSNLITQTYGDEVSGAVPAAQGSCPKLQDLFWPQALFLMLRPQPTFLCLMLRPQPLYYFPLVLRWHVVGVGAAGALTENQGDPPDIFGGAGAMGLCPRGHEGAPRDGGLP